MRDFGNDSHVIAIALTINPLTPTVVIMATAIKHPSYIIFDIRAL